MTREVDVVQSLVDLADTLVADYDVVDLLTGLTDRCVHVLNASAAGVMLAAPSGDLRLVASSSEAMRVLELFELQAREGPCLDAYRTGERVAHEHLHAGSGRWPHFATVATEAGFNSAFALPLRLRETTIGALNLVNVRAMPMDEADVIVARAFADLATICVLQQRATSETQRVNEQLSHALHSRIVIEQAKGVVFERAGIDMSEAFAAAELRAQPQPPPHRRRAGRHRRHARPSSVDSNLVVAARTGHPSCDGRRGSLLVAAPDLGSAPDDSSGDFSVRGGVVMSSRLRLVGEDARDGARLRIGDLEEAISRLLDRHLSTAREWFPHEYVPWERAREVDRGADWDAGNSPLNEPARVALYVNLLTEDNLPYYTGALASAGGDGPWAEWTRRWTAEEGRHAIVMRDYVMVTNALDPVALERGRMQQVSTGAAPRFDNVADLLAYTSMQELATRISHRNTGALLGDRVGADVMNRVAADENLHFLFYRDLASAAIEIDPSTMVAAIDRTVRHFEMPGTGIADFPALARAMAASHVYDFAIHYEQVIVPIVLKHWKLEHIEGLDAEAEQARDRTLRYIARLQRAAQRIGERST